MKMAGLRETFEGFKSDLVKIKRSLALPAALPRFLRDPLTVPKAEEEIRRLLDTRADRFLELARREIYERPDSAYLKLLRHAGCDFSDLHRQVHRQGLEETLIELAKAGVYLTSDEFKGKKEVVRGGESFRVSPGDFERQDSSAGFGIQSSGTRNAPVSTFSSLDWRGQQINNEAISFYAHDLFLCAHALYEPIVAGRVSFVLINAKLGIRTERWFANRVRAHGWLENQYHYFNICLTAMMGTWFGPGIAKPEFLDEGDVRPVVEWVLEKRREGKNCCIRTVVSNAVRIARRAAEMGVSLEGTKFRTGGEPLTESKQAVIERVGALALPGYGFGGGLGSALSCGRPLFRDEVHIPRTLITLVEHPKPLDDGDPPIYPLLLTTLHPTAPRLLLNVENGDYATLTTRDCGCALHKVGFTQHLHTIRSFEKFTSEGMNYFSTDLFELLENAIPAEFGGGPGDYQLVEEEDGNGQTRLTLLVDPDVGAVDEANLLSRLQQGLAKGSRNNRFMTAVWQDAGTFRIRRERPHASARGKILPLRINR
jgi:hypothetical protein